MGRPKYRSMGCEPDVIDGRPCDWPDCAASTKCATRRRMTEWSERSNGGPSQRVVEAGGSLALEAQGADGSSPDNDETGRYCQTVWAWQARWEGVGRANQWLNPLKRGIGSNLADVGRGAVHACPVGRATLAPEFRGWRGGHEEGSAAYSWRGCRGKAGRRPRRSVGDERGNRPGAARLGRAGSLSAVGLGVGRSLRSSPRPGKPVTWRRRAADLQRSSGRRGGRR
jgi:hypothetical protein